MGKIPNGTENYVADQVIFRLVHLASKTALNDLKWPEALFKYEITSFMN